MSEQSQLHSAENIAIVSAVLLIVGGVIGLAALSFANVEAVVSTQT